jgi:D-amino-acid dehydrogenase
MTMDAAATVTGDGKRVVIVGSGVIGVACAHFLAERGYRVTCIDKGAYAAACSQGNCGLVCPSHVLPLAEPGAIRTAIKAILSKSAPFRIQPRLDLSLWMWLWNFARRCNTRDMLASGHAIQPLLESSIELYQQLVERDGIECEWQKKGLLFVYRSRDALNAYSATDALLRDVFDAPAKRFDGDAVVEFEPALLRGLAGGWYYDHDAHLRPDKLMSSWRERLESRGVQFREHCEFRRFVRNGGNGGVMTAVETAAGTIPADLAVVATGALTPMLSEHLGCPIPIQPGKGYSLTMPRPRVCPTIPMIFPEHRVAVTPMQTGYRLGSIMEFAGYDESIAPERLELLREGARHYLIEPECEPVLQKWYGWRPMTFDSQPIIDRSPALSNVFIAAGHNMLGLSMAPGTGRLLAELVTGGSTHIDATPYRVSRFR